jgi:hypothetical protein
VAEDSASAAGQRVAHERGWVLALAVFAALRVLWSSALFPFFNNVDEPAHFDLVVKYDRGELPRGLEPFSRESVLAIVRYGSPEFFYAPERFGGRFPEPLAARSGPTAARELLDATAGFGDVENTESAEPPLYYSLAALWLELGRLVGLAAVTQLFWLRALNAVPAALLVWLGHVTARTVFPESSLQRLGVPLLLAVFPQDTFYSIGSDMLSPLCFGLGFLGVVRFGAARAPTRASAAGSGLALAAAVLVKLANLPLIGVACAGLLLRARGLGREQRARSVLPALALLLACAAVPIAAWLAWNRTRFGDWTGTAAQVTRLDWTPKPLAGWWPHPLFSAAGLYAFWSELLASFWRGEFVWHGQRLAHRAMDVFYWGSSAVLPAVALIRLPSARGARAALVLAAFSLASGVAFLVVLSLAFDFGHCFYPSRAHPYFTSGRLLSGALIPFLLLYVHGVDRSLAFTAGARSRWLVLFAIAAFVTASETWLDLAPLASAYNVFHLGGWYAVPGS